MEIAVLGMGTIGSGVVEIVNATPEMHVKKILDIAVRRPDMTTDINDILRDSEIELVVETMGGLHPAFEYAKQVLGCGKHFVTANKYLVSEYGKVLRSIASKNNVGFLYSAACGGGIPYLLNLSAVSEFDTIEALGGILNGTTNYILDSVQNLDMDYADALKQAQDLGYAERNPSSDINGTDTMRKLVLACGTAFDAWVNPDDVPHLGIANLSGEDVKQIRSMGGVLKLCAVAERNESGFSAYVEPTIVSHDSAETAIRSNVNYAWYCGRYCGLMGYSGQGAGKLPTATNILRDIQEIRSGRLSMTRSRCADAKPDNAASSHAYYVRTEDPLPESWVCSASNSGLAKMIITNPVSVETMHEWAAAHPAAFVAGIRQ